MYMENKILLVIVEGQSDEYSLAPALTQIVPKKVKFKVMRGDIIGDNDSTPENIERRIKEQGVKKFLEKNQEFTYSDICEVVHITDMDGVYIPDESVIVNDSLNDVAYFDDHIEVNSDKYDRVLNSRKNRRAILNHLISLKTIAIPHGIVVPYQIYYMSCNLDHVTVNKLNADKDKKLDLAMKFGDDYDDPVKFYEFFNDLELKVSDDYLKSWEYIKLDHNSLQRHSNLNVLLDKYIGDYLF